MSLADLYKELVQRREGDTLRIDMSFPEDTVRLILLATGEKQFLVNHSSINNNINSIVVNGTGNIETLLGGEDFLVTWSFEEQQDEISWIITFSIHNFCDIESLLGKLPESRVEKEGIYALDDSVLKQVIIRYPKISLSSEDIFTDLPFILDANISLPTTLLWEPYSYFISGAVKISGYFSLYNPFSLEPYAEFMLEVPLISNLTFAKFGKSKLNLYLHSGVPDPYGFGEEVITSVTLACEIELKNVSTPIRFAIPLFRMDKYWKLLAEFEEGLSLSDFANFFMGLLTSDNALLIPPNTALDYFRLYELQFGSKVDEDTSKAFSLQDIELIAATSRSVILPIPWIRLDEVALLWQITWNDEGYLYTAQITGSLSFLLGDTTLTLSARALLPSMELEGHLSWRPQEDTKPGKKVTLTHLTNQFGVGTPSSWTSDTKEIAHLDVAASFESRTFYIRGEVNGIISFHIGNLVIALEQLYASAFISETDKQFILGGVIGFGEGKDYFTLFAEGEYGINETSYWKFNGGLQLGVINIGKVLTLIFGLPEDNILQKIFDVTINALEISYSSEEDYFSLLAGVEAGWDLELLGTRIEVSGRINIKRESAKENLYAAVLFGLKIGIFQVAVQANDFYSENSSYLFRVYIKELYLQGAYSKKKEEEILTITMGGMSLGKLIESLVKMLNPNAKFQLSTPWNLLNKIELSRFFLVLNTTKKTASFYYLVDVNIAGLMYIEKVGINYTKGDGNGHIYLLLTGRLLEQTYGEEDPLSWDVVDGKPPEASAVGEHILELYYIGMGQHVSNNKVKKANSIKDALEALESQLKPPPSIGRILPENVSYDDGTNWLFGVDFRIANAVRVGIVLDDPNIYGLVVEVKASDKSPLAAFNGLNFELLYKKITEEVGMFKATLRLPDKYRTLNLGYVVLTIGVMSVEVYTNGDFLIDLGFPHNADFTNSFMLQVDIYIGHGGIYFGVLSSVSTKSVPTITDGTFSPVIVLGIGLSLGVGKIFDFGIVKGGISLEVMGIFEGVLAFYKPSNQEKEGAIYYYVSAIVGIIGQLYLSVDLKVVTIRASVKIMAYAQIVLECYKAMKLILDLSLELCAQVKILFIKINFSYSFHKRVEFILGSDTTPPWCLGGVQSKVRNKQERWHIFEEREFRFLKTGAINATKWDIEIRITPLFSVENPEFKKIGLSTEAPSYCVAFLGNTDYSQLKKVIEMITVWVMAPWEGDRIVYDAGFVPELAEALTYQKLFEFLQNNAVFGLEPVIGEEGKEEEAAVFPMLPPVELKWEEKEGSSQQYKVDYWLDNKVPSDYADQITDYFEKLNADPTYTPVRMGKGMEEEIPMAQILFLDYFQMLMREIIQRICNLFEEDSCDLSHMPKEVNDVARVLRDNGKLSFGKGDVLLPSLEYALQDGDTLAFIGQKFKVKQEDLLADSKDQTMLLSQNSAFPSVYYNFSNEKYHLNLRLAAALFFIRYHEFMLEEWYPSYVDTILKNNPELTMEWECVTLQEKTLVLPMLNGESLSWNMLRGDTVLRLAKICALYEMKAGQWVEWDHFLQQVLTDNHGIETEILPVVRVSLEGGKVDGDLTMDMLFRRVFPDRVSGAFEENPLWNAALFTSLVTMRLKNSTISLIEDTAVEAILKSMDITLEELAQAVIVNPSYLKEGQIIVLKNQDSLLKSEVQDRLTKDFVCKEIGAMTSRFLLQGLRVPKPSSVDTAPLYKLAGQQQLLRTATSNLWIHISKGQAECNWLSDGERELTIPAEQIASNLPDKNIYFDTTGFVTLPDFIKSPKCYSPAEVISYVYTTNKPIESIQKLTDTMRADLINFQGGVLAKNQKGEVVPCQWGTLIPFTVGYDGTKENCFTVYGADAIDRLLLHKLLNKSYQEIGILYPASMEKGLPKSLVGEEINPETSFFVKTNLSLETHMGTLYNIEETPKYSVNMQPANYAQFLQMLWECSVVGGGGYYLRFETKQGGSLPLELFQETGQAKLWLMALLTPQEIMNFDVINCSITRDISKMNEEIGFYPEGEGKLMVYQPAFPPGCIGLEMEVEKAPEEVNDGTQRARELFQIVGYAIEGDEQNYKSSNESPPLVPTKGSKEEYWRYTPTIPIYDFIKGEHSIYSARGKNANISLEFRDVLGNRAKAEGYGITVLPDYNDLLIGIHEWTGNTLSYMATGTPLQPVLTITCSANKEKNFSKESVASLRVALLQLSQEDVEIRIESNLRIGFVKIMEQEELTTLKNYAKDLLSYVEGSGEEPKNHTIALSLVDQNGQTSIPADIFFLDTNITIVRKDCKVLDVKEKKTEVYPFLTGSEGEPLGDEIFANELERVLPMLRLAKGSKMQKSLFGVSFGQQGFIKQIEVKPYRINGVSTPSHFALRPLKNGWITRESSVSMLKEDGTLDVSQSKVFQNIDMEIWAKDFLSDVEKMLSLQYAQRAVLTNNEIFNQIVESKKNLANAITEQLEPLMIVDDLQINMDIPKKLLKDRLLKSLLAGYSIDVVAQYQMVMTARKDCRMTTNIQESHDGAIIQSSKLTVNQENNGICLFVNTKRVNKANISSQGLELNIPEMEYNIEKDGEYESSEWLRFLRPIKSGDMGIVTMDICSQVPIPIPKKNCPYPPELIANQCITHPFTDNKIEELLKWDYELTCGSSGFEQDAIYFKIQLQDDMALKKEIGKRDLLDALAQFETVRTDLWKALDSQDNIVFANGLATFMNMTKEVAAVWQPWLNSGVTKMINRGTSKTYYCEVTFKLEPFDVNIRPLYGSESILRELGALDPLIKLVSLNKEASVGENALTFTFTIPKLPLYGCQKVTPTAQVIRNKNLYEDFLVNPLFIYQTPEIGLEALSAWLVHNEMIVLDKIEVEGKESIREIIKMLSRKLDLDSHELELNLGVWYSYGLTQGKEEPSIRLPVTWIPNLKSQKGWIDQVVDNIYQWYDEEQPDSNMEHMIFSVIIYSPNSREELLHLAKIVV